MKTGNGMIVGLVLLLALAGTGLQAQEAVVTPDDPQYVGKLTDELLAAAGAAGPLQKIEVFRAMARERIREMAALQERNRHEYDGELLEAYSDVVADGLQARIREAYAGGIELGAAADQVGQECTAHAARLRIMAQTMNEVKLQKQARLAVQNTYALRIMTAYMAQVKGTPAEDITALQNAVQGAFGRSADGERLAEAVEAGLRLRLRSRELGEVVDLCGNLAEGGEWFRAEGPACVAEELRSRTVTAEGAAGDQEGAQLMAEVRERVWQRLQTRVQQMAGGDASQAGTAAQVSEQLRQMIQNQKRLQKGMREMRQDTQNMNDRKRKMDTYRR